MTSRRIKNGVPGGSWIAVRGAVLMANGNGISRRGFLLGAATGVAAGVPLTLLGAKAWNEHIAASIPSFAGVSKEVRQPKDAMPGPFPGRVIEVRHPGAVRPDDTINAGAVKQMMDRGICELTGAEHSDDGWRRFFNSG